MMRLSGVLAVRPRAKFLVFLQNHPHASAGLRDLHAIREVPLQAQRIEMPNDRPRVSAQVVAVGLEFVQLLDDVEGNNDLVIVEHE